MLLAVTDKVRSAERLPPPDKPVLVLMLRVFGTAPLTAATLIAIDEFAAAVRRPCASTAKVPTVLALPYDPAVTVVFARLAVTFAEPLNDVPVNPVPSVRVPVVFAEIVPEPPKLMEVPLIVILEFVRPELGIVVLIAEDGMLIVALLAAVNRP